ncbi:MAG: hypothetical protein H6658_01585 [Ardenticatenaceae bacterium]|nr:hypothetical protein [Ardenticatenaceae bacterium]
MKLLTQEAQARAKAFIFDWGRPLDQSRYLYHFENGSASDVLTQLTHFQNEDGGFGHALEPDMRMTASSVLATTVSLQILGEIQAASQEPAVQAAMRYLLASYEPDSEVWPIIPRHNNDFPHAPWWHDDGNIRRNFGEFRANPRAEIVGYLFAYNDLVPDGLAEKTADAIITHLHTYTDKVDMHDLACYIATVENTAVPATLRQQLLPKLRHSLLATIETDPAQWGGYTPKPLAYIHHPDSPFASLMPEAIAANLDDVITRQQPDGSWPPPWSWAESYPQAWAQAQNEWAGILTLNTLKQLRAFDRLEADH